MVVEQAERLALAREWKENIAVNSQRALAMGLSSDASLGGHFAEKIKAVTERTTAIQKRYAEIETTPEGRAGQDELADVRKRYLVQREALFEARGDAARTAAEGEVFKRLSDEYNGVADEVVGCQIKRQAQTAEAVIASMARIRWMAAGATLASVVLATVLGWRVARSVTQPLQALRRSAQRVAGGDLTEEMRSAGGRAETAQLAGDIAAMQAALRRLVAQVRDSTDSIDTASREVARRGGGGVVQQVVSTMDQINAASRKIAEIIGTIDGIAFQTNILALNAAVEAARAGEQGNGAVAQIEQTTQQNAALVEQSAAAAASLREQAQRLTAVVAGFRLAH